MKSIGFTTQVVKVWKGIIKFSPIAVFALFANLAGTISISQLDNLMIYLLLFLIASLSITFWIMPGLISSFIDYPIVSMIKRMRSGILMAAATMLPITSIPYILEMTREMTQERDLEREEREGLKETIISFSYPLVQLGNLFVYLFIGFAAFYYKHPLNLTQEFILPLLSIISTFGTPVATVNATSFLSSWLDLSTDTTELYVELMTITRYFQVIVTAAGLYFITIVVTFAYYNKLRLNVRRLAVHLILPLILLGLCAYGLFFIEKNRSPTKTDPALSLQLPESIHEGIDATIYKEGDEPKSASFIKAGLHSGEGVFKHIQRTGVLRVGYNPTPLPFSYFNDEGELVGYDVAFAYDLARTLNVDLVFVPYTWEGLNQDLKANRFDMAISGIYVTKERIRNLSVSNPYFKSRVVIIAPSEKSDDYRSRQTMSSIKGLRIGVFKDHVLLDFIRQTFPKAKPVFIAGLDDMLSFKDFDSIIWTKQQAVRLASMKNDLSVVMTRDLHAPLLFAYMMPPEAEELRRYINYWLALKKDDGFKDRMKAYWFDNKTRAEPPPRWSIIRNVLHWVD